MDDVLQRYCDIICPIVEAHQAKVYDIATKRLGRTLHLQVRVDKPGRITLDECVAINEAISQRIDELKAGWFGEPFVLDVSSPGAERELTSPEAIQEVIGEYVHLDYFGHQHGETYHEGVLVDVLDEVYILTYNDRGRFRQLRIQKDQVRKIRLAVKL
ncbi:ribosome maturation factor [Suicoccus acidiformans]|uniref:Ribosome maturation factor RimP n=1 Tax=Suicoccus acidiformans TaxID=2036206 RepID=A0A347WLT9_9LACT|nr:ribosome maturation factor [Suicoccus acidiformans]AXY26046.1 ribosome maturation factor [Suicoccus acidiformans]